VKTRQWDLAIRDLTTAISLQLGGSVLLMNVDQFRAIYPEYKAASNEAIARKLNQTFYPNLTYDDFAKKFFTGRAMPSAVTPGIYLKRMDACLKAGNWRQASMDFRRGVNGFPDYANVVDRWREVGQTTGVTSYPFVIRVALRPYGRTKRRDDFRLLAPKSVEHGIRRLRGASIASPTSRVMLTLKRRAALRVRAALTACPAIFAGRERRAARVRSLAAKAERLARHGDHSRKERVFKVLHRYNPLNSTGYPILKVLRLPPV
jgi:hypothetical protein